MRVRAPTLQGVTERRVFLLGLAAWQTTEMVVAYTGGDAICQPDPVDPPNRSCSLVRRPTLRHYVGANQDPFKFAL